MKTKPKQFEAFPSVVGIIIHDFEGEDGFGQVLEDGEVYTMSAIMSMQDRKRRRDEGWEGPGL